MKTTNACKFPKPILLGFEKGYGFLDGIIAQPINTWKEALEVKKQLLKDADAAEKENRETIFKTVIVDTIDIAYTSKDPGAVGADNDQRVLTLLCAAGTSGSVSHTIANAVVAAVNVAVDSTWTTGNPGLINEL